MKRSLPLFLLSALLLFAAAGCANPADDAPDAVVQEAAPEAAPMAMAAEVYGLSEDSTIHFVGAKVTGSHDGGFKSFQGSVSMTDGTAEGSSVEVVIDTTSLWADTEKLTGHLKSADFFDVETYPTATFKSTAIAANEAGGHTITGNLELHGVTKQISFPATVTTTEHGFSAAAEFSINRKDFEIIYPGKPDDLIRDDVLIKLDLRSAAHGEDEMMEEAEDAEEGEAG